jgi:hypothetical protein
MGVFGTALLQLCVAKYFQLHKLRSKKKVKLEINFTFFLEHLKRYSSFWSYIIPRGVEKQLPTLPLINHSPP